MPFWIGFSSETANAPSGKVQAVSSSGLWASPVGFGCGTWKQRIRIERNAIEETQCFDENYFSQTTKSLFE